ncbi:MAG: saccharopine dehydrogenase family protein [Promethearchaeota archaeon]
MKKRWMIYGAYGYTGKLITREAINQGVVPVLAGRSADKLTPLAKRLNLDYLVFDLKNENTILKNFKDFDLIFNAAGPFKYTSAPIIKACLKTGTNYVDITGEVSIFEQNFKFDQKAKDKEIVIISGVGFDVVPSDCMAKHVSEKIPNPMHLELGISGLGGFSPGTLKTMVEYMHIGPLIRRDDLLIKNPQGNGARKIRFLDKERKVYTITWGDLSTAYRTTGIPNITIYMPLPKQSRSLMQSLGTLKKSTSEENTFKELAQKWIEKNIEGPDEQIRQNARSYIWARVANNKGEEAQAWLETMEAYRFTAIAGVRCVEKLFNLNLKGVLTPALAFGKDFILELPETNRYDFIYE